MPIFLGHHVTNDQYIYSVTEIKKQKFNDDNVLENSLNDVYKTEINKRNIDFKFAIELIKSGADSDLQNRYGETLLHLMLAARFWATGKSKNSIFANNTEVEKYEGYIRKLINECCWDINKKNKSGMTPLQLVMNDFYDPKLANLLVSLGANINTKNQYGETLAYMHLREKYDQNKPHSSLVY